MFFKKKNNKKYILIIYHLAKSTCNVIESIVKSHAILRPGRTKLSSSHPKWGCQLTRFIHKGLPTVSPCQIFRVWKATLQSWLLECHLCPLPVTQTLSLPAPRMLSKLSISNCSKNFSPETQVHKKYIFLESLKSS